MCMRMGSDAGRNFLSTKDPVKNGIKCPNPYADKEQHTGSTDGRPVSLNQILKQFYFGRSSDK